MNWKIIPFFLTFFILIATIPSVHATSSGINYSNQSLEIFISTTKTPHQVNAIGIDTNIRFYLERLNITMPNNFEFAEVDLHAMEVFHHINQEYSSVILTVEFKGDKYNIEFANKLKDFYSRFIQVNFSNGEVHKNSNYTDIVYYQSDKIEDDISWMSLKINQFYDRIDEYSYSKIFTLNYLENLYKKQGKNGNFGYIYIYDLNSKGVWARIEFSNSTYENYSDGTHTYDLLKILNLTYLPPGQVNIEGNAMQTYTHTYFYFKNLNTNVNYTVENITWHGLKAFVVHINTNKNITQLVISLRTKENYNFGDFMSDYGFLVVLGITVGLTAVIVLLIVILIKKIQNKYRKK